MIAANNISKGMLLEFDGRIYKVLDAELRGSAKAEKQMHLKLRCTDDAHLIEKTLHPDDKVHQIHPVRYLAQYLYRDNEQYYFMHKVSFEQIAISADIIGRAGDFLKEDTEIHVEAHEEKPINIDFPEFVEMTIDQAPEPLGSGSDTTYKEAALENGHAILVPQFIKTGDVVKVDVETGKYMERMKKTKK